MNNDYIDEHYFNQLSIMNILLIHPATGGMEFAENYQVKINPYLPPLGLLYLAAILEKNNHKVTVIDCNAEILSEKKCKTYLKNCDVVGMTVYCHPFEEDNSLHIRKMIKEIKPDIPIILGGPHASLLPEQSLKDYDADICVIGRGEKIINKIIEAINDKRDLASIPNICFKQDKKIMKTKTIDNGETYDEYPLPARHLVDKYDYGYISGLRLAKGRLASIITSRGCANRCNFCNVHEYIPKCSFRSIESIKREIDFIHEEGYETLVFVDDNFMIRKNTVKKIMDYLILKKYNFRIWIFGARANKADRIIFEKMKKAGVDIINFGIESGSQKILDYYNKKLSLPQIKKAVNLSKEMGFITTGTFIIGAPIETREDIKKTIKFSTNLPLDAAIFFGFHFTYKSKLWKDQLKKGLIKPSDFRLVPNKDIGIGNFTPKEIFRFTRIANFAFFMNLNRWIRTFRNSLKYNDPRLVKQGLLMINKIIFNN